MVGEHFFYNAVNTLLESDYGKLKKTYDRFGSWSSAWQNLSVKTGSRHDPEKEWDNLSLVGAKLILRDEPEFPETLKEIHDPPFGIYVLGKLPEKDSVLIAIVGTRKATSDGKNAAKRFAKALAENGFTIVSGLALGIDAAAHEGCLEANGKTIAVLGCGIGRFYPSTNEHLANKIIKNGGAVISEYPPGTPPLPYRFLERNRIVSGICRGILVVEAPEKSGSLVTARLAMEQNRDVFVMPGSVSHPNYRGSNQLIRSGAELVTKPEEILQAYGFEVSKSGAKPTADSEEEQNILDAFKKSSAPMTVDKIKELTNLDTPTISRTLTLMIIKNIAEETGGGYIIK